jgi:hypothetical protein
VPRVFARSVQGRLPLIRIGWAVVRPQAEDRQRATEKDSPPSPLNPTAAQW